MKLMPPSENSVLISFLETDIVLQHLRSALDNLAIAYRETACGWSLDLINFLNKHIAGFILFLRLFWAKLYPQALMFLAF